MPYHVKAIFRPARVMRFFNLNSDALQARVIDQYEAGTTLTSRGISIAVSDIRSMLVYETDGDVEDGNRDEAWQHVASTGRDVTDDWITRGPGSRIDVLSSTASKRQPRRVMVVHGRNLAARDAMFVFLGALDLQPVEWTQAVVATAMGSPHNLAAVRAAMELAQAVVVILTAEDEARLRRELAEPHDGDELELRGQPRQNVTLEAGLAMGIDDTRVILVQLGSIRGASDFDGLNKVRLDNSNEARGDLRSRLRGVGCQLDDSGVRWLSAAAGGDFEACLTSSAGETAVSRSGQLEVVQPNAYAFADGVRLRFPLVFRNAASTPVIVANLRLVVEDEPDQEPLEWITTRAVLRPQSEDGFAYAIPFAVDAGDTREVVAEFGDDRGWSPPPGKHYRLRLEARIHPVDEWVEVRVLDWWAPPSGSDLARYLTYRNEALTSSTEN